MTPFPRSATSWILTLVGLVLLALAFALHLQMFAVVLGQRGVAPGGGEFAMALFAGVPTALLALLVLGIVAVRSAWRSRLSVAAVACAFTLLLSWVGVAALWP